MIVAFIGKVIAKSKGAYYSSIVAVASVAEALLLACKSTLVEDARFIKTEFKKRLEADTQKLLAESSEAANNATTAAHGEELRVRESERLALENRLLAAKTIEAEATADKARIEAEKAKFDLMKEVIEEARKERLNAAQREVLEALMQYTREGGKLYIDSENLKELLKLKNPSDEPPKE